MDNFDSLENQNQQQELQGTVERVIYASDDGNYTVFSVSVEDDLGNVDEVVCTAGSSVTAGEDVKIYGAFVVHPSYGEQFKTTLVEKALPQTVSGMEAYLATGNIKGIGKKRAAQIVEVFGLQTFQILEENPALLSEIKGITPEKALEIGEAFAEKGANRNSIMYLQTLGLTVGQCEKVMKRYGGQAIDVVKNNPYVLAREVFGIGFKIADGIAAKVGVPFDSPFRIEAGITYILLEGLGEGHVCLPRESLLGRTVDLLGVDMTDTQNQLLEMQLEGEIKQDKIDDETMIYLAAYYHSEVYIARRLLEINRINTASTLNVTAEIARVEKREGIALADMQKKAVDAAMNHGVVVITGGPGTGKTTTIKTIISLLDKLGQRVSLCAPTGRAAKRMNEATGKPAATIHRLLGIFQADDDRNIQGELDDDMKIQADCIIMDEASMVYSMLLFRLLKAMNDRTRLILVGDVNQLPSVGAGNVLKDIIASEKIPVVYLDEIFRQGQESAIVMNAHRINRGEYPIINDRASDFFFIKEPRMTHVAEIVADLNMRRLPSFTGVSAIKDIQVLCPQRKTLCGVENLNKVLQEKLNPPDPSKSQHQSGFTLFREGDKVMQIKNNYQTEWRVIHDGIVAEEGLGVFNGDEGLIEFIDNTNRIMRVVFYDDKVVDYPFKQLEELNLAYAITIHKSQGSEYDVVILPLHSGTPLLFSRNLLYTAITRAKKLVVIVGVEGTINRMVDNVRETIRHTALAHRIEKFYEQLHNNDE
ncbi:MAG: ATP-dependent RecD-like DNA helicase [Defluviitaleaceae bacterium]|nr:ATP-dependent RecD-like DNA helicase [Defluviitaleaceae bacterium]